MTENKRVIATDLKKLDAHVVQPNEYEDAPELTDEQLAAADVYEGRKLIRRGRPPSPTRKRAVKLRIDPDVLEAWRASGPGWQTRINDVLRQAAVVVARTGTTVGVRVGEKTFLVRKPKPAAAAKATVRRTPRKKAAKRPMKRRA